MQLSQPIFEEGQRTGAWFNLPGFIMLMLLSYVLVRGVRESAQTNNTMVLIKIVAILLFVFGAAHAVNTGNWHPFMPNGIRACSRAARSSSSLTSDSIRSPPRPKNAGVRSATCRSEFSRRSAVCASALWLGGAGAHRHRELGHAEQRRARGQRAQDDRHEPAAADCHRRRAAGHAVVAAGVPIWAGAHLVRDVARPLLPDIFRACIRDFKTPYISTWVAGFVVGIPGRHLRRQLVRRPFEHRNAVRVYSGVGRRDRAAQEAARAPRGFRVPWVPLLPGISIFCCMVLMLSLPLETWLRFFVWLMIGLFIYFLYGKKRWMSSPISAATKTQNRRF
jgi:basic amino acid/polyamine antiporter, APA family